MKTYYEVGFDKDGRPVMGSGSQTRKRGTSEMVGIRYTERGDDPGPIPPVPTIEAGIVSVVINPAFEIRAREGMPEIPGVTLPGITAPITYAQLEEAGMTPDDDGVIVYELGCLSPDQENINIEVTVKPSSDWCVFNSETGEDGSAGETVTYATYVPYFADPEKIVEVSNGDYDNYKAVALSIAAYDTW